MSNNGKLNSILALYQDGMCVTKIARRKRIAPQKVSEILHRSGFDVSSAVANKRRAAAEEVRDGRSLSSVALESGRSISWLRAACNEHGIELPSATLGLKPSSYKILAALQRNPDASLRSIAQDFDITFQRVQQILAAARENEMVFPGRNFDRGARSTIAKAEAAT